MEHQIEKVKHFHRVFKRDMNELPTLGTEKLRDLRANLIIEEALEFYRAAAKGDLVEMADALADILYVTIGTCVAHGIPIIEIFDEVHRSNMSKVFTDGFPRYREDGKVIKPRNYSPANIAKFL